MEYETISSKSENSQKMIFTQSFNTGNGREEYDIIQARSEELEVETLLEYETISSKSEDYLKLIFIKSSNSGNGREEYDIIQVRNENCPHPEPYLNLWQTGEHLQSTRTPPHAASQYLTPGKHLQATTLLRSSQSPSEEEPQSLPRIQEQPVTLGRRGPKSNQSPLEKEDPGAASHPQKKRTQEQPVILEGRRPRNSQSPSEEEDPGAPRHHHNKRPPLSLIQGRNGKTSIQKYIQQRKKQDITSPPPTPRPEHCNVDKAEENDLKNSLMKMIEEALEGKMKNAIK
ncbi:hypothetical protein STEG23_023401 [Scotinomys teguina]